MLTVVVYHYVRPVKDSAYPEIKGLEYELFIRQLEYFNHYYEFVSIEDVMGAFYHGQKIPNNSILLTFDDGYIDHYQYVFPELMRRGIRGVFFPVVESTLNNKILSVNKIHFILASVLDKRQLVNDIEQFVVMNEKNISISSLKFYKEKYMCADEWDAPEVNYIKRMLQQVIPDSASVDLVDDLFKKYVKLDESAFAKQLYLSVEQLKIMGAGGMCIGGHGFRHSLLEYLSIQQQEEEIQKSFDFFRQFNKNNESVIFSYPHGSYNNDTMNLLEKYKCKIAFTVEPNIVNVNRRDFLQIERLDTNHFPTASNSKPNSWTLRVI